MKEVVINVKGMMCSSCENRVKNALSSIDGVENVTANHNTCKVIVTLNKDVSKESLKEVIEDIGYETTEDN